MKLAVESGGESARPGGEHSHESDVIPRHDQQPVPFSVPAPPDARPRSAAPPAITPQRHGLLQAFQSLVYVVIVALFIVTFTVQPFRIPSASMEPTLLVGDFLLVDKQVGPETAPHIFSPANAIHRGDIIVFHYPVDSSMHLVKRVIGLPGDRLRLREGRVYINGSAIPEPYAVFRPSFADSFRDDFPRMASADPAVDSRWWIQMHSLVSQGELTVPPESYFVLGDNRNDSEDSRYWGFVPSAAIVGKPFLVYFSLNDSGSAPGQTVAAALPGDGAARRHGPVDAVIGFARWERAMHIVR